MLAAHGHATEEIYSSEAQIHDEYVPNPSLAHKLTSSQVDVILIFLPSQEKEFVQNMKVQMRQDGAIDFCQLLKSLKAMSFPVEKNIISYYSYTSDMYVHCGNDPIASNSYIPAREVVIYGDHKQVTIRIRQVQSALPLGMEAEGEANANKGDDMDGDEGNGPKKRTKERRIGEVLDKVLQWRRLYTGVTDPATGQTVKLSLEESATRVGIGKKSLDDYLLQIRFGKKFGFNFNDHYNDKVGVLRSFVKKFKGKDGKELKVKKEAIYDEEENDDEAEYTPRKRTTRRK